MIDQIFLVNKRWNPRVIGIEGVAYQKAIKYFIQDEMERRSEWLPLKELKVDVTRSKETRIRGLQPVVQTRRLFVQAEHFILLDEIRDFPLGEHDDTVDALAMHLQLWRGVVSEDRLKEYKTQEERFIRYAHRATSGYGTDSPLVAAGTFDDEPDEDDLEVRSDWEHQATRVMTL
jgi:hypothetical protein